MKTKTVKTVASAMVLVFGLTIVPAPVFAESTNIVADTEGVNTLTLSQIQQLAVIYNDTVDTLELSIKQIELQEQMTRNQKRKAQNSLDDPMFDATTDTAQLNAAIKNIQEQITELTLAGQGNSSEVVALKVQLMELQSGLSAAQSIDSAFESTIDGISQLNDALDQLDESKADLKDSMEDLEQIMRYSSAQMALSVVQLDKTVELLEEQIALLDKSIGIYELQEKLGMTTTINVDAQRTSKVEAQNSLNDTKEQLDNLKRSLNLLIGRPANNPLEVVPMELSGVITPAPEFTQELITEFVTVNPKMETLLDERQDLKDSVKSSMGSDEKQNIEYQIQAKNQELKTQRQAAEDDLKAMIATINSNAVKYRVSKEKLATEQKNYEIALKKYELGMISQLALTQAELSLAQAELTNLSNGYQHYFDWQQYNLAKQGIDMGATL